MSSPKHSSEGNGPEWIRTARNPAAPQPRKAAPRGEHKGYDYTSNKRKADLLLSAAHRNDYKTEISIINITPNKKGILRALNQYAGHPDNG